jgi:hypothetical protein
MSDAMLSERHSQLLTAYVDGELDARQRVVVEQLVAQSAQARDFLAKLEGDSKELKALPVRKAPDTLAELVLQGVQDTGPMSVVRPRPASPAVPPSAIPAWLGLVVAACVLVAVGVASFFAASGLLGDRSASDDQSKIVENNDRPKPEKTPENPPPPQLDPMLDTILAGAAEGYGQPVKFKDAGVRVVLSEFKEEPIQKRLSNEISNNIGLWLDVPSANNVKAVDRVTEAFQKTGIKVVVEKTAGETLNKAKKDTKVAAGKKFLLYTENLKPGELTKILESLGDPDPSRRAVEQLVIKGMTKDDRQELAKALNVDEKKVDPKYMAELPTFIEGNIGKDGTKGKTKTPDRYAVLLPYSGAPGNSDEVKKFMRERLALNPGAHQVVVVIHDGKAA